MTLISCSSGGGHGEVRGQFEAASGPLLTWAFEGLDSGTQASWRACLHGQPSQYPDMSCWWWNRILTFRGEGPLFVYEKQHLFLFSYILASSVCLMDGCQRAWRRTEDLRRVWQHVPPSSQMFIVIDRKKNDAVYAFAWIQIHTWLKWPLFWHPGDKQSLAPRDWVSGCSLLV